MSLCRTLQLLIVVGCTLFSIFGQAFFQERKPNVVFILADDLGYRELGCFGQELIATPNLDHLAHQGMWLT